MHVGFAFILLCFSREMWHEVKEAAISVGLHIIVQSKHWLVKAAG